MTCEESMAGSGAQEGDAASQAPGSAALDHGSDVFRMYHFKVLPCCNTNTHDWLECAYAHDGEKAARRCPKKYNYTAVACPDVRKAGRCPRGDACPYAHSTFEYWLHPTRYRTQLCSFGAGCRRAVCFFAHSLEELRTPTLADGTPTAPLPTGNSSGNAFGTLAAQEQQHRQQQLQAQLQRLLVAPSLEAAAMMAPTRAVAKKQPKRSLRALPQPAFANLLALHQQQQSEQEALLAQLTNGLGLLDNGYSTLPSLLEPQPAMQPTAWSSPAAQCLPPSSLTSMPAPAFSNHSHIAAQMALAQHHHMGQMFSSSSGASDLSSSLLRALSTMSVDSSSSNDTSFNCHGDAGYSSGSSSAGSPTYVQHSSRQTRGALAGLPQAGCLPASYLHTAWDGQHQPPAALLGGVPAYMQ